MSEESPPESFMNHSRTDSIRESARPDHAVGIDGTHAVTFAALRKEVGHSAHQPRGQPRAMSHVSDRGAETMVRRGVRARRPRMDRRLGTGGTRRSTLARAALGKCGRNAQKSHGTATRSASAGAKPRREPGRLTACGSAVAYGLPSLCLLLALSALRDEIAEVGPRTILSFDHEVRLARGRVYPVA